MRNRIIPAILAVCLLLTGCGLGEKRYVSVTPHRAERQNAQNESATAKNSQDLIWILEELIQNGRDTGVIQISDYPAAAVDQGMEIAMTYILESYPLGAYAVGGITYEVGTTGGRPAIAVELTYRHNDTEIRQIRNIQTMEEAEPLVAAALSDYDARLVFWAEAFEELDFQQMVRDYAETYPETVMEIPQVTVGVYGQGLERVVELSFAYQTGRDSLRQMQAQVKPVFEAAELYVSGSGASRQKYSQLYAFLMERFDYEVETSITPAYSLLHHGVGDSRAFATVYAAMCRRAGLECLVVAGTRSGEPWVWNIVQIGEIYQHVDLLGCSELGRFQGGADWEMDGYVWDYSAYPECSAPRSQEPAGKEDTKPTQPEQTEPAETESEETVPGETTPTEQPEETQETTEPPEIVPQETEEEKIEEI